MGSMISSICDCMCVPFCPHSKGKTTRAIITKLDRHAVYSSRLVFIDPEVNKSKVVVIMVIICAARIVMHVDRTA